MNRIITIVISLLFLAYGLVRLVVSSLLFGDHSGLLEIAAFQEPLQDVARFMAEKEDQALVPLSVTAYLGYLMSMGFALTVGAIGTLTNRAFGLPLVGGFLLLWSGLFLNFQTINPKILHLGVFAALYAVLWWAMAKRKA